LKKERISMKTIDKEGVAEYSKILGAVREKKPLVHHITNYVTVNDCANITLAIGASPIMADAIEEARDIASIASSVVLNIGTLNNRTVESMIAAGKAANQKNIPVIFDPVGAGASKLRNDAVKRILNEVRVDVLRGNISEIGFIQGQSAGAKGVDASEGDLQTDAGRIASDLARTKKNIVAVTGAVDAVSDGHRTVRIKNGHSALSGITGTGCMCSSLAGSFCGAAPNNLFAAAVAALIAMGVAGEIAYEKAGTAGNGSFRVSLIDAVSQLNEAVLTERAKLYEA
jgi:hydroxyethylthiazole kinase